MARSIRFALLALSLFGTALTFSACMDSPTGVVQQDCCFSNDH